LAILALLLPIVCGFQASAAGRVDAGTGSSGDRSLDRPRVPAAILPPGTATVTARFHATGVQIYTCGLKPGAAAGAPPVYSWALKAPDAALTDTAGAPAGHHTAGPTWTSTDGSSVAARKVAEADAPVAGAVPWLLLQATATTGKGVFTGTTFIQRVNTTKGKAPAFGCDAGHVGTETRADYTADYYFYRGGAFESPLLAVGQPAPDFTAVAHDGKKMSLAALKGKMVVLYFYPRDDTSGCTKEACDFRDNWTKLQKAGVVVLGVSTQDNGSHKAFAEKFQLPFPLLPDEKGEIAAKYLVPVVDGKARRITYLIGKDGRINHVWPAVNPAGHAAEVLAAIAAG
jgi:peroxiredoxin Q/BCP